MLLLWQHRMISSEHFSHLPRTVLWFEPEVAPTDACICTLALQRDEGSGPLALVCRLYSLAHFLFALCFLSGDAVWPGSSGSCLSPGFPSLYAVFPTMMEPPAKQNKPFSLSSYCQGIKTKQQENKSRQTDEKEHPNFTQPVRKVSQATPQSPLTVLD